MDSFDELFGQPASQPEKKSKNDKKSKPLQNDIFAGIGTMQQPSQSFQNSASTSSFLAQIQGQGGAPTNEDFNFDNV